jgi:hypothetical protein
MLRLTQAHHRTVAILFLDLHYSGFECFAAFIRHLDHDLKVSKYPDYKLGLSLPESKLKGKQLGCADRCMALSECIAPVLPDRPMQSIPVGAHGRAPAAAIRLLDRSQGSNG